MTTKVFVLEQFLIVIWHSNKIELDNTVIEMNPRRVDIPKDKAFLMDVKDSWA